MSRASEGCGKQLSGHSYDSLGYVALLQYWKPVRSVIDGVPTRPTTILAFALTAIQPGGSARLRADTIAVKIATWITAILAPGPLMVPIVLNVDSELAILDAAVHCRPIAAAELCRQGCRRFVAEEQIARSGPVLDV